MAKSVIIADDTENFRNMLARSIGNIVPDARVVLVPNGESLVERVREGGYSLAVTDYDMGEGIDGVDAIMAIREFDKQTPIYMLSGSSKREDALSAGATGYISKTDKFEVLIGQIEEMALKHLK